MFHNQPTLLKAVYRILPEENIVVYRVVGAVGLEGMKRLFYAIKEDPDYSTELCGLADLREAVLGLTLEEVKELSRFVLEELPYNKLWVTIVSSSIITALALLFSRFVSKHYGVAICSTEDRASILLEHRVEPLLDKIKDSNLLRDFEKE